MRLADAPKAGWYPDPEGSSRLRWWDGSDWTDRFRSKPVDRNFLVDDELRAKLERQKQREEQIAGVTGDPQYRQVAQQAASQAAQQLAQQYPGQQYAQQAQQTAQEQWQQQQQRASEWARQQSRQARQVAQQYSPLVAQQAQSIGKYIKRLVWLIVVLVLLYWFLRLLAAGVITDLIDQLEEGQSAVGVSAGVALWGRYRVDL